MGEKNRSALIAAGGEMKSRQSEINVATLRVISDAFRETRRLKMQRARERPELGKHS